jgi:VCBS repeat-containing protein
MRRGLSRALVAVALTMGTVPVSVLLAPSAHAVAAGELVISEFRVRGPNGANDEFIEIANTGAAAHTVAASSGTGYGIAASDGVTRCSIPDGTVIPGFGHYLCVNSVGYSLASYPAGNGTTATGDATYSTDIPDNAGIALFDNNTGVGYTLANRIDAVGSTSEANTLYKEGTGYPALTPFSIDYSFYRNLSTAEISTIVLTSGTPGVPQDTNKNAADFVFVDTNGTSAGAGQRLGAPGPENLSSPVGDGGLAVSLLDPCVGELAPPNVVRDSASDPANNSTFGTYEFRRTITNNTGANVTRLRLRVADVRTFPAPSGIADLRLRTSSAAVVSVDRAPCGSGTSNVTMQGTTLEQPPSQPNGGGFNSSLSVGVITLATPLAAGASVDVRLLAGIQQTGGNAVRIIAEAITGGAVTTPVLTCLGGETFLCAPTASDDGPNVTSEDTPLTVTAPGVLSNDTDPDRDPLTAKLVTGPAHGTLTLHADGGYTYTPDADYNGPDSFTYEAHDGSSPSIAAATVTLEVTPVDDPMCAGRPATLVGTAGDDMLTGTAGADVFIARAGDDTIDGLGGDDVVCARAGRDTIRGGAGDDTIRGGAGADGLGGNRGNDTIRGDGQADTIRGHSGNDVLTGGAADDVVRGGAGEDTVRGRTGVDRINAGPGHDQLYGGSGRDQLFAGDGDDTMAGGADRDLLFAGDGDDTMAGGARRDVLFARDGDDTMAGGAGRDLEVGGLGHDRLRGGYHGDALLGGPGDDRLWGGPGNDLLDGGPGSNHLRGGPGRDRTAATTGRR